MNKLTKFSRALLATAMSLIVALPSLAHDFEVDGIFYNYIDKTTKTVRVTYKGNGYHSYSNEYTGKVAIPSSVTYSGTTYSVTSIGSYTFYGCSGLTSVTIPNSVTYIGYNAFSNCTGLTSVTIPNSVNSIDFDTFSGCTGLTSVTIPNSVTSISSSAFEDCTGLLSITIPNSVTEIGAHAFYGTAWYNNQADGVIYINNVLYEYKGTMPDNTSINTKEGTVSISPSAFSNCTGLTSVTIPNSVTEIGEHAFYNCSGLTSVTIPNSVTSIENYAFGGCSGLTEVTIPNSVTKIMGHTFYGCSGLTEVTIPNSVTSIFAGAFKDCSGLTEVTIPNSVTSIGSSTFYGCSGLTSVTIPNSVTEIGSYAFSDCSGLTSVTIPNSVTSIENYAFGGCSGLTSVTIPNSVTSIYSGAFEDCKNLETIITLNPTPPTCSSSSSFYSYNYTRATLYVPKDSFAKYFVDDVWGQFSNIKKIETLVSSITFYETTLTLNSGNDYMLNATALPSNATIPNLTWESDNHAVATVDEYGKVTGISAGTATITVRANDGSNISATCKVTVNSATPSITLSHAEATFPVNEIMTLSYTITNSFTKTATWSTSDANVAYVKPNSDGSATIVGMGSGVATITATLVDNGKEYCASCKVTVVDVTGIESVEADNNAVEVARYDIHGRLLSEPAPGINIVKYSDGTTRKEIVK